MTSRIDFYLGFQPASIEFGPNKGYQPTDTLLYFLRKELRVKATRQGCGMGDCGACTVVLAELRNGGVIYKAINSCLMLLPSLQGKWLILPTHLTAPDGALHPVQESLLQHYGIQCGFCTSGMLMSMFSLYKSVTHPSREIINQRLSGNLCRCTGYQPILEACIEVCNAEPDRFTEQEPAVRGYLESLSQEDFIYNTQSSCYYRPYHLQDALYWLQRHPALQPTCGSTDLVAAHHKRGAPIEQVLDLSAVEEMLLLSRSDAGVDIGAAVAIEDVREFVATEFPVLREALGRFASHQIRNVASLAGNIASASPIGDAIPLLMAHHAVIHIAQIDKELSYPIRDFVTGYKSSVLKQGDLISSITLPPIAQGVRIFSFKLSKRKQVDISSVSMSARLRLSDQNIVEHLEIYYGGMADQVKRAFVAEELLIGADWSRQQIELAASSLCKEFTPLSDARATSEGRMVMAQNLLYLLWEESSKTRL